MNIPASLSLLRRYQAFLARENLVTLAEIELLRGVAPSQFDLGSPESYADRVPAGLVRPDAEAATVVNQTPPSSRAALVLAAAGMKVAGGGVGLSAVLA